MQLSAANSLCPASRRVAGPASTSARAARPRAGVKVQAYKVTITHKGERRERRVLSRRKGVAGLTDPGRPVCRSRQEGGA